MKKLVIMGIVSVIALLLLAFLAIFFFARGKISTSNQQATPTPKPKLSLPVNVVPPIKRPYITLSPTSAREVILSIENKPKKSEVADYELQYSSGDKEEAAIGELKVSTVPVKKTILLGSQSGGGKITYHEEVTGGSLVLTFYDENYKISNEWAYIDNRKPSTAFSSRDGKFRIAYEKPIQSPYVILFQNPGFPTPPEGEILAGMYSISTTGAVPSQDGVVEVRVGEDVTDPRLLGWTGDEWIEIEATLIEGFLSTNSGPILSGYVVVK